jgi:hypothetical protein
MSTRDGFKGAGTKASYERRKKKAELKASQANAVKIQPRTYQVGDVQMSEEEYRNVTNRFGIGNAGKIANTPNTAGALAKLMDKGKEAKDVQAIEEQFAQEQAQQQVQEIQPMVTEADIEEAVPQTPLLDQGTAIGAGVTTGVGTALGTAALAAKVGGLAGTFGGPLGVGIGAAAGFVTGIGAYYTKIAFSKRGDVKQAKKVADIANRNFGQTIDALNAGIITRDVALKRFKEDKTSLYAAHANLKRETNSQLDKWLSGGADELAEIEDYIQDLNQIYENEFILALAAPDPNRIRYYNPNQGVVEE